jgi:hypothetical protein
MQTVEQLDLQEFLTLVVVVEAEVTQVAHILMALLEAQES